MIKLSDIKFKETAHFSFQDEYITSCVSTNVTPTVYLSVNTPRDKIGFASGKPKWYLKTIHDKDWFTEVSFKRKYLNKLKTKENDYIKS